MPASIAPIEQVRSIWASVRLPAIDVSLPRPATAVPIIPANTDYVCRVQVRVFGPPGQFAFFAADDSALQNPKGVAPVTYPNAFAVPTGATQEFWLNIDQNLIAVASISPQVSWGTPGDLVWVSAQAMCFDLRALAIIARDMVEVEAGGNGGSGGGGGGAGGASGRGGGVAWKKR